MYSQYWGLQESPFANNIEERWFYESPVHEEALARLLFLVEEHRRCGVLFGPAGTGKSLLLRILARQMRRTQRQIARIDLLGRTSTETLWELAAAAGLSPREDDSAPVLWRSLQDFLQGSQSAGQATVFLFDHLERAQPDCLALLERLVHFQTRADQWTTIVFVIRQNSVSQHATALRELSDLRIELPCLDRQQSHTYVRTLLQKAGRTEPIFDTPALDRLFELSGGVPRELNRLADLALLAGTADGESRVGETLVRSAAADLCSFGEPQESRILATARI